MLPQWHRRAKPAQPAPRQRPQPCCDWTQQEAVQRSAESGVSRMLAQPSLLGQRSAPQLVVPQQPTVQQRPRLNLRQRTRLHQHLHRLTHRMPMAASHHGSPSETASCGDTEAEQFEAARQRLYSRDGVPDFLMGAADELRTRHPSVPFLDHAWGQVQLISSGRV